MSVIKKAWCDRIDPTTLPEPPSDILKVAVGLLRTFRMVDWDQTMPLTHDVLDGLNASPEWIQKIRHFFVDEYQDFNRAEQALILLLADAADSLVIVGDDDQSLYSGRGGSPDGIRNLYADPKYDRVSLVKCYRCRSEILTPANTFQAAMSATPRPMTVAHAGGQVLCHRFKSSKAEVGFLVEYLNARVEELPDPPRPKDGIACLFPSNRVLKCYFDLLSPNVACLRRKTDVSPTRLHLDRILRLLLSPNQPLLQRLLLNGFKDIKAKHHRMIIARMIERDIPPSAACESLKSEGSFTGKALLALQEFVDACTAIGSQDLVQVAHLIDTTVGITEASVVEQLPMLMAADQATSNEIVDAVCDLLLPETAAPPEDPRAVLFLTMHGSKGLTRKTVVIPGLEEAWLPGGATAEELPERRRLFFVAMSRATDNLLLTFPRNRGRKERLNFNMPGRGVASPFIALAGLDASYHT